jgi:hypothetical protein
MAGKRANLFALLKWKAPQGTERSGIGGTFWGKCLHRVTIIIRKFNANIDAINYLDATLTISALFATRPKIEKCVFVKTFYFIIF